MIKDSLGDRMKGNYENRAKTYLTRRMPVILRLDGKAFHTFTRKFQRPYDEVFHNAMNSTAKYLCENIQGCKIAYTQSDEITLLLTDYDTLTTDAWFDYGVQKMCSVAASMTTAIFNKSFIKNVSQFAATIERDETMLKQYYDYNEAINKLAMFDCRCFNIPKEEVTNCFIWRQQDATRNAIQMLGQCNFSTKELHGKSCNDIQDMLMTQKNINFNDMPIEFKRGICVIKKVEKVAIVSQFDSGKTNNEPIIRSYWEIDKNIPIFSQDRDYIERVI